MEEADTRLILLQSSEPESHRKQGGAFAVCSPQTAVRTAAIYEDGANGGLQAISSVRHSKQVDENDQDYGMCVVGSNSKIMLPHFGAGGVQSDLVPGEEGEEEPEDEVN